MPELPEVETMVRGIRPYVTGRKLIALKRCRTRCKPLTIQPPFAKIVRNVTQRKVAAVRRLGKRILFDFEGEWILAIEPRMTGLMVLSEPPDPEHLRLQFEFDGQRDYNTIWFWDRRGLGTVRLFTPGELEQTWGSHRLGPDAASISLPQLSDLVLKTSRAIKVTLLDQSALAGIGNLYASEILHVAAIHPERTSRTLTKSELRKLHAAIIAVLDEAIQYEGSTLGDGTYRNALNKAGGYQNIHRVYQKQGQPCSRCARGPIVRTVQAQRATFFCPHCQR